MKIIRTMSGSTYVLDTDNGWVSGDGIGTNIPYESAIISDGHVYITLCSGQLIRTSAVTEVKDAAGESCGTRDILYGFAEWLTDETSFKENGRMYVVRSGAIYDAVEMFLYEAGI